MTNGERTAIIAVNVVVWPLRLFYILVHLAVAYHALTASGVVAGGLSLFGLFIADGYWGYQLWGQGWLPILALINVPVFFVCLILEGLKETGDEMIAEERFR